jgi:hypothetical protein
MLEATLGSLTFVGDAGAATYTLEELDGWFVNSATMRREYVDRPNQHGQFATPGFLSGRIVTLSGKVHASSDADFEAALVALSGLLADGESDTLTVTTGVGATTATVYRYGMPRTRVIVWGSLAEYQLQLWAPDPVRYGPSAEEYV